MIVVGIDAHKYSHTAAIVERASGRVVQEVTVASGDDGHRRLLDVARGRDGERVWAIEDCRNVSGALERFLLRAGERVIRVHPKLMATRAQGRAPSRQVRCDRRDRGRAGSDPRARSAGRLSRRARSARSRGWSTTARSWSPSAPASRAGCAGCCTTSTRPCSRPLAGWATRTRSRAWTRALAALEPVAQVRIGRRLVERLGQLNPQIAALARELAPLVKRRHALLLAVPGCGVITAARLIAEIANIARFRSDAKLASYAGVAPVDASSGKQLRHRLNRAGNRQLNAALHVIALTQARIHAPARDYLARRRADGKTPKEGLRALKRHLARHIYRLFTAIHSHDDRPPTPVNAAPAAPV